jgi:diguanylate cyclase (GGDEF)-like protein
MDDWLREINSLRQQVEILNREKADLECVLETIIAHSDTIENQLHQVNQALQSEIIQRQRAETALQDFLQSVLQEKADLEIILETVNSHGDGMMEFLYEKFLHTAREASTDALTQLANRRSFDECLQREWRRLARNVQPLALLICDVDYFKAYNDTYGHTAGDKCLRMVAQAIRGVIKRPADLVARYGGEEFAVILPEINLEGAQHLAEEIHTAIHQLQIVHAGSSVSEYVTISTGVACQTPRPGKLPLYLTIAADKALYRAKRQGRNQIICQTDE